MERWNGIVERWNGGMVGGADDDPVPIFPTYCACAAVTVVGVSSIRTHLVVRNRLSAGEIGRRTRGSDSLADQQGMP